MDNFLSTFFPVKRLRFCSASSWSKNLVLWLMSLLPNVTVRVCNDVFHLTVLRSGHLTLLLTQLQRQEVAFAVDKAQDEWKSCLESGQHSIVTNSSLPQVGDDRDHRESTTRKRRGSIRLSLGNIGGINEQMDVLREERRGCSAAEKKAK